MATITGFVSAGPQDPLFGIYPENIADRLTRANWKQKAVVRKSPKEWLYILVYALWSVGKERKGIGYTVHVYGEGEEEHLPEYEQHFPTLRQALAYANGEDGGKLATQSSAARPEDYPIERDAPTYFFTLPSGLKKGQPVEQEQ